MKYRFASLFLVAVVISGLVLTSQASATNYGNINIISDSIMSNTNSMSASQINSFLNGFAGTCLGTNRGFTTRDPQGYSSGSYQYGGNVDAGTAIKNISVRYGLNPQVLLATLEKEQGLVSRNGDCHPEYMGDAPAYYSWSNHVACSGAGTPYSDCVAVTCGSGTSAANCSYACRYGGGCSAVAIGYACPGFCKKTFADFSAQISGGSWVLRFAEARAYGQLTGYSGYDSGDEYISYSGPMTPGNRQRVSGGSSAPYDGLYTDSDGHTMYIGNGATASMLNYTPFYARSYTDNKLFHTSFTSWFGSPTNVCGNDMVDAGSTNKHLTGDFNADGRTEASIFRATDGCWHVRGVGDSQFGQNGDIPVPADYNGDGRADVGIFRNGDWHVRGVGDYNGYGQSGDIPVPADYNGDGRADAAVYRPSQVVGGEVMWHIRGVGDFAFGHPGDIPVPADYNGDGRADIAVFRPSTGNWHIRDVGDIVGYGQSGDIPVPADYNGDGRADAAVYRPSQQINGDVAWHIRGVGDFGFGHPGDIPVPGDYNGHGRANIAVFRPSNGDWHMRGVGDYNGYGQSGDYPTVQTFSAPLLVQFNLISSY